MIGEVGGGDADGGRVVVVVDPVGGEEEECGAADPCAAFGEGVSAHEVEEAGACGDGEELEADELGGAAEIDHGAGEWVEFEHACGAHVGECELEVGEAHKDHGEGEEGDAPWPDGFCGEAAVGMEGACGHRDGRRHRRSSGGG